MGFESEWPPAVAAATTVAWYVHGGAKVAKRLSSSQGGGVSDEALEMLDEALEMLVAAAARGDLTLRVCDDAGNYWAVPADMIRRAATRRDDEVPSQGLPLPSLRPLALVGAEIVQRDVLLEEAGVIFSFHRDEIEQMFRIEAEQGGDIDQVFFNEWGGKFPREWLERPTANSASRARFEAVERLARESMDGTESGEDQASSSRKKSVAESILPHLVDIQRRYRDGEYAHNRPGENHRSPIPRMARDLFALVNLAPDGTLRDPSDPDHRTLKTVENQLRLAIRANPDQWPGLQG
jgi:hypothetical protein